MPAIPLPKPRVRGAMALEEALSSRRSVRAFGTEAVTLAELAQLLWAGQGLSDPAGMRCAPSAGALYPLELYVVAGRVGDLEAGIYRYRPEAHELARVTAGDRREALARAALGQGWLAEAAAILVIAAAEGRTASKYGARAQHYVSVEAGHAAENVALQAVALGLGTTMVGAFDEEAVASVAGLAPDEVPQLLVPIGRA